MSWRHCNYFARVLYCVNLNIQGHQQLTDVGYISTIKLISDQLQRKHLHWWFWGFLILKTDQLWSHYRYVSYQTSSNVRYKHDDVIKWKHFPRYWPFVRGIHRSPVNYPHKGQWRGAFMFSLICARVNNGEAGDLRRHRAHYDVIVMNDLLIPKLHRLHRCSLEIDK